MLTADTIRRVTEETLLYWRSEVTHSYFIDLAKGKEIGHKMADLVDEKTTALLTVNHQTRHQYNSKGERRARSMGDTWLLGGDICHPINVKTGVVGSEGQPNLVSLKKVLSAIIERQIDSYYLLMVKMAILEDADDIQPSVVFTDMLDWLPYTTFDAGPGQMMLRAKAFFADYDPAMLPSRTISEKVSDLFELYQDGERRLRNNRDRDLNRYRDEVARFLNSDNWTVTPSSQRSLSLL